MKKIVIDAGHTRDFAREHPSQFAGVDWEKTGLPIRKDDNDSVEHMFNVAFANVLAKKLDGEMVDWPWMSNNAEISKVVSHVNSTGADLLVSIHANATGTSKKASGTLVLYYPTSSTGKRMAKAVAEECKATRKALGGPHSIFDTIAPSSVAVLAKTHCPAILIEACFYDNLDDLKWTWEHLDEMADAVIRGLRKTYQIS